MTQRDSGFYIQSIPHFIIFAVLFMGCLLAILFTLRSDFLRNTGIPVEAVVIGIEVMTKDTANGDKSFVNETVQFEYPVDGHLLRPRQTFFYDTSYVIGQKVPVRYLPDTPWVGKIQTAILGDPFALPIVGLGMLLPLILVIGAFRHQRVDPRQKQKRKPREEAVL